MTNWLFEGRLTVYLFLAVLAGILVALWTRDRRRKLWLILASVALLLVGVYFLLDRFVETRREQITRKLQEMAFAVKKKDVGKIFQHISDNFQTGSFNKATFRQYADTAMQRGVDDLQLWDVKFPDDSGKVVFFAKPKSTSRVFGSEIQYLIRAEFAEDSDGQWRLRTFQVFNPFVDTDKPLQIPQLPF